MNVKFINLDDNESIFFARELEFIKARSFDIKFPQLKARMHIPVSFEAGPGAESITYSQFDSVGIFKVIGAYADDLPRSDVRGKQFTSQVKSLGGSYGYSVQEIRSAALANKPLVDRKAMATRRSYEQKVNRIGWFADGSAIFGGLQGFLFNPNTTKAAAPTGNWIASATPDQIIDDINNGINKIRDITKGIEEPDTVLLPVLEFSFIASKPRSATTDTTILEFVKRNNPGITTWDWVNELKDVTPAPSGAAGPTNIMLTYKKDPGQLSFEIPQDYEQFPPQARNLEFVVPAHGRNGGVIIYYPLSIFITEGI